MHKGEITITALLSLGIIVFGAFMMNLYSKQPSNDIRTQALSCNYSDCETWRCPGAQCDKCASAPYYWWASGCPNLPAQNGCCTPCGDVAKIFRSGIDPQTKCISSTGYKAGNDGCYHPDNSVNCGGTPPTPTPTNIPPGYSTATPTTSKQPISSPTPTTASTITPTAVPTLTPVPTLDPAAYQGRDEPCTNAAWDDIIAKYNSDPLGNFSEYLAFLSSCVNYCRVPGPQMCFFNPKAPPPSRCPVAPVGNPCAVDRLLAYFDNDIVKATNASRICFRESGGDVDVINSGCTKGKSVDFSIGLFQINMLPSSRCPGAFYGYTWDPPSCPVKNQSILDECVRNFTNSDYNIRFAYQLSKKGTSWSHWAASGDKDCNLP